MTGQEGGASSEAPQPRPSPGTDPFSGPRPKTPAALRRVCAPLAGDDPAPLDVPAVKCVRRQPLAVDIDAVVLAADHKIAPLEGPANAVHDHVVERVGRGPESPGVQYRGRVDPQFRPVGQGDRTDPAGRGRFQQRTGIALQMEKAIGALPYILTGAAGDADLLPGRVARPRGRSRQIDAGPVMVVV